MSELGRLPWTVSRSLFWCFPEVHFILKRYRSNKGATDACNNQPAGPWITTSDKSYMRPPLLTMSLDQRRPVIIDLICSVHLVNRQVSRIIWNGSLGSLRSRLLLRAPGSIIDIEKPAYNESDRDRGSKPSLTEFRELKPGSVETYAARPNSSILHPARLATDRVM